MQADVKKNQKNFVVRRQIHNFSTKVQTKQILQKDSH